ncbi:MAG: protein kinase domain-containing protein [Planctomycetota bacterium]
MAEHGEAPGADEVDAEAIYDRYLDASLTGEPEEPAAFFARYPSIDTHGRERIEALHTVLTGADPEGEDGTRLPFERVGGYRLLRVIGRGAMGAVYLADQEALGRLVALKLLRPQLSMSRSALERFRREAKIIARLSHPNVVKVHELGEEDGTQFLAMELVPGRSLQSLLIRGRPSLERTLAWVEQCARALQAAHDEGIVHRDVKPGNILVTPDDRAILLDFGMAHLAGADGTRLTQTFAGSPSYAAPEQIDSLRDKVDGRTDIYGLGATLYECLTQKLPFVGGTLEEIFQKILRDEPVAPHRLYADLPRDVETVTLRAMAKRPQDRYQTAREFAEDLRALLEKRRIRAKPPGPVARTRRWARRNPARATALAAAVAGVLGLFALAGWQAHRATQERRAEAARAIGDARDNLVEYQEHRAEFRELTLRQRELRKRTQDSFLSEERFSELDQVSEDMDNVDFHRQTLFHETLELLRRAERLDPTTQSAAERLRARLYIEQMEEAFEKEDFTAAEFFRDLVHQHDPTGDLTRPARESARLAVTTDPPGAAVFVFRDQELHEFNRTRERRFIPVPVGDKARRPPDWIASGGWALRVIADCGELRRGDLILELNGHPIRRSVLLRTEFRGIPRGAKLLDFKHTAAIAELDPEKEREFRFGDRSVRCLPAELPVGKPETLAEEGGLPAKVRRNARVMKLTLPEGLEVRTTAAPMLCSADNCEGLAPIAPLELEPGDYRLLVRKQGWLDTVVSVTLNPGGELLQNVKLPKPGDAPRGFVYIPDDEPYWIMEREVTCREYLEFLDATQHVSDWPRDSEGKATLPEDFRLDWPAIGLTFFDCAAYARWKGHGYALPTRHEWVFAARGKSPRVYVFGNVWRPRWAKSCFSRPRALPEAVLSYPIDESVFGVYDMTGSAAEWIDDWFDKGRGLKRLGGSSWGFADPQLFKIWGGDGADPNTRSHTYGFRLVWKPPNSKKSATAGK